MGGGATGEGKGRLCRTRSLRDASALPHVIAFRGAGGVGRRTKNHANWLIFFPFLPLWPIFALFSRLLRSHLTILPIFSLSLSLSLLVLPIWSFFCVAFFFFLLSPTLSILAVDTCVHCLRLFVRLYLSPPSLSLLLAPLFPPITQFFAVVVGEGEGLQLALTTDLFCPPSRIEYEIRKYAT